MSSINDEQKKQISDKINKYKNEIEQILAKIKNSEKIGDKIDLYQKILNIDNTKELYVLDYLLCLKQSIEGNQSDKNYFKTELNRLQLCISDKNYLKHFSEYPRKNARQKIVNFIDIIKNSSFTNDKDKSILILNIVKLLGDFENINFINKKKITWENEELYLNSLYKLLIFSVSHLIIYNNHVKLDSAIKDNPEYIAINNNLKKAKEKKDENGIRLLTFCLINFLLLNSFYFKYLTKLQNFLISVDSEFHQRFGNLELNSVIDRDLFEDYIYFLATYKFERSDYDLFWKETFVPLNPKEKEAISKSELFDIKCEFLNDGKEFKIYDDYESYIVDPDKYNLKCFINNASQNSVYKCKWYLNKYMKPNYYKTELFVYKTKNIWRELLINIFQSRTYTEARNSLFEESQVDIFLVDQIIKDIIDNVKFFIYNTTFMGCTNNDANTIYEYGNIDLDIENESVALLIFYGFHIIINIHEIGGHLNIKLQYFISLNDAFHSPDIKEDLRDLYTNIGREKNKESGETMEIELFGKVKNTLRIQEALFILNKDNYSLPLYEFKAKFQNCKKQKLEELLNEPLKAFLSNLGIDSKKLKDNDTTAYKYPINRKTNKSDVYYNNKSRHPPIFYFDMQKGIKEFFEEYPQLRKEN